MTKKTESQGRSIVFKNRTTAKDTATKKAHSVYETYTDKNGKEKQRLLKYEQSIDCWTGTITVVLDDASWDDAVKLTERFPNGVCVACASVIRAEMKNSSKEAQAWFDAKAMTITISELVSRSKPAKDQQDVVRAAINKLSASDREALLAELMASRGL